jgi:hypothetical protein
MPDSSPQPNSKNADQAVTVSILLAGRADNGKLVSFAIPAYEHLQSLTIEQADGVGWSGTLTLFAPHGSDLERLLASGAARNVILQWNWEHLGMTSAPKYYGTIIKPRLKLAPEGITFNLEMISTTIAVSEQAKKERSFAAGTKIIDIIREIVDDNDWAFAKDGWEDNAQVLKEPRNNNTLSDVNFMAQLAKEITNAAGEPFLLFLDENGNYHCHTANYRPKDVTGICASYVIGRAWDGEVVSFEPSDDSFLAAVLSVGNTLFTATDRVNGTELQEVVTRTEGIQGVRRNIPSDARMLAPMSDGRHSRIFIWENEPEEFRRRVRERVCGLSNFPIQADMEVLGTHLVRKCKWVRVTYLLPDGSPHWSGGDYFVSGLSHTVGTNGWSTQLHLAKNGMLKRSTAQDPFPETAEEKKQREARGADPGRTDAEYRALKERRAESKFKADQPTVEKPVKTGSGK